MHDASLQPDAPAPIIAREGWPIVRFFVLGAVVLTIGASFLHPIAGTAVAVVTGLLCAWCIWFFRDPQRNIPADRDAVICPADGVVCAVGPAVAPAELGLGREPMTRVCVFMNVFNVHVNRAPIAGRIVRKHYSPGKFFNAALDKASTDNERMGLVLERADGTLIGSVQIAGLVARRIICRAAEGQSLSAGERYGLIRFGSRVDVYMPRETVVNVALGQPVVAGETVLARLAIASKNAQPEAAAVGAGA